MIKLLPLLLFLTSSVVFAEAGSYRVEAIVFQNLAADAEAIEADSLRSFSGFPALQESALPDDLKVLTDKSSRMDGVWRRLRSSKGYRPLLFAAWQQNRTDFYPPMRVHDETLIDTQLQAPTAIMIADLAAEDPLAAYMSDFYRLDGTIQLRRSRFLHLFVDLEIRLKQADNEAAPTSESFLNTAPETEQRTANQIFRLKQNRQIRTATLQYFDTPYFGVLLLVTRISPDAG